MDGLQHPLIPIGDIRFLSTICKYLKDKDQLSLSLSNSKSFDLIAFIASENFYKLSNQEYVNKNYSSMQLRFSTAASNLSFTVIDLVDSVFWVVMNRIRMEKGVFLLHRLPGLSQSKELRVEVGVQNLVSDIFLTTFNSKKNKRISEENYKILVGVCKHSGFSLLPDRNFTLKRAITSDQFDFAKFLVEEVGMDLHFSFKHSENTFLHLAAKKEDRRFVRLLTDHGADTNSLNADHYTPLEVAQVRNNTPCVEALESIICEKISKEFSKMSIERIIRITFSPNSNRQLSVEEFSVLCRSVEIKDINQSCPVKKETALHGAARCNEVDFIEILLENEANINAQNKDANTPLHIAVESNSIDALEVLLEFGANINVQNSSGNTPLHIAAESNSIHAAEVLLDHGADVNIQNKEGRVARDYIKKSKNTVILGLSSYLLQQAHVCSNENLCYKKFRYLLSNKIFFITTHILHVKRSQHIFRMNT